MPSAHIIRQIEIARTPRVVQVEALFDVPPSPVSRESWDVDMPLDDRDWNVGLIVGASGTGKSTIARELFGAQKLDELKWHDDLPVVDEFPEDMAIKDVVKLMTSVGFGSPPNWLRPYHVLSTGEQFRASVARAIAESAQQEIVVIDEFTSVVDRQVAQVASHAVQKTIRRQKRKLIAVTCHYDVLDWLQPDWVYEPATSQFAWREVGQHPPFVLRSIKSHGTHGPCLGAFTI